MSKDSSRKNFAKSRIEPRKAATRRLNAWPIAASISILIYGLYRAVGLRWICDDAFITMRYVKNFVDGNVLVYNIGERVEGYTHFLWLMLLASAKAIGFDPVDASIWLGIASYTGILILLLAMSLRIRGKNPKAIWLPLAAALYALNYDTEVWASGGLETSLYTLLILSAFFLWFYTNFSEHRRLLFTGLVLALVSLTRPDGALFTAVAAALLAIYGIRMKHPFMSISKSIGILILPSIAIGIPYLLWKYFYYGDVLPNTYYAKSANENYFSQGLFYIWLYFRVYFTSAIALAAGAWLLMRHRDANARQSNYAKAGSPVIAAAVCILVYLILFVAYVGGDFMFARFIIPIVPFVYFIIEQAIDHLPTSISKYRVGIAMLLVASLLLENKLRGGLLFHTNSDGKIEENWSLSESTAGSTHGIADERWTYYYDGFFSVNGIPQTSMDVYSEEGKYLEPFFQGLKCVVAIPGAENMVAYYANFGEAINEYGLTDSTIARLPIMNRTRIGHEKIATESYLVKRRVNFELQGLVAKFPDPFPLNLIAFQIPELGLWQLARMLTYDKTSMDSLSKRFEAAGNKSVLPIYEEMIPYYVLNMLPKRPLDLLEDDYLSFKTLYFDRYPDASLEQRFEDRIAELKRDSAANK